jgi:hypothetical protein
MPNARLWTLRFGFIERERHRNEDSWSVDLINPKSEIRWLRFTPTPPPPLPPRQDDGPTIPGMAGTQGGRCSSRHVPAGRGNLGLRTSSTNEVTYAAGLINRGGRRSRTRCTVRCVDMRVLAGAPVRRRQPDQEPGRHRGHSTKGEPDPGYRPSFTMIRSISSRAADAGGDAEVGLGGRARCHDEADDS